MSGENTAKNPKWMTIVGWALSVLPCLLLAMSAYMKLSRNPQAVDGFKEMRYPDSSLMTLGLIELGATLLFLFPKTAVFGATLLVGYLGGAVATHVIKGDPYYTPVLVGVVLWLALYFRDARVRALTPWVR